MPQHMINSPIPSTCQTFYDVPYSLFPFCFPDWCTSYTNVDSGRRSMCCSQTDGRKAQTVELHTMTQKQFELVTFWCKWTQLRPMKVKGQLTTGDHLVGKWRLEWHWHDGVVRTNHTARQTTPRGPITVHGCLSAAITISTFVLFLRPRSWSSLLLSSAEWSHSWPTS